MTAPATTLPAGMVEVTQADRDAASAWFEQAQRDGVIRKGHPRDYPLAEAFARHRLAATRPAAATDAGESGEAIARAKGLDSIDTLGSAAQRAANDAVLASERLAALSLPTAGVEVERLREALRKIADCRVNFPGDVVDIARAALAASTKGEG